MREMDLNQLCIGVGTEYGRQERLYTHSMKLTTPFPALLSVSSIPSRVHIYPHLHRPLKLKSFTSFSPCTTETFLVVIRDGPMGGVGRE